MSGYQAKLEASGTSTAMAAEACSVVAGTGNVTWQVDNVAREVFDWREVFTVEATEDGTTWNTLGASEFSLSYLLGRVDLDGYASGTGIVTNVVDVRITGSFLPLFEAAEVPTSTLDLVLAELVKSYYGDAGERRVQGRADVSLSFDSFQVGSVALDGVANLESSLLEILLGREFLVLSVTPNRTASGVIRAVVKLFSESVTIPGDGLVSGSFSASGAQQTPAMASQSLLLWDFKS